MAQALDAILEIFSWVGFGAAVVFALAAVAVWAADGSWLPADAYLDDDGSTVRWIDGDRDVNSASLPESYRGHFDGRGEGRIWYRHGWHDRMRLTRRPPVLKLLWGLAVGGLVLGILATVGSVIALFVRG